MEIAYRGCFFEYYYDVMLTFTRMYLSASFVNSMKMNHVIILCSLFSLAVTAVIPDDSGAQIVKSENFNDGSGNYEFSYETSNGIARQERGYVVNIGTEDEHIVVEGSFSYTDPDGNLVLLRYKADENGYQINPPILAPQTTYSLPPSVVATLLGK